MKEELPYRLTLPQLLLGAVEVEVHVETLHELRDRVLVRVRLLQNGEQCWLNPSVTSEEELFCSVADLTC